MSPESPERCLISYKEIVEPALTSVPVSKENYENCFACTFFPHLQRKEEISLTLVLVLLLFSVLLSWRGSVERRDVDLERWRNLIFWP
jgi:hypothetical protein